MAKKCSTCKRSYPDHLPACPHCNPAQAGPSAEPFDDPFAPGEDVHQAETVRPAAKKPAKEEIIEAPEEVTAVEGASDVLSIEEAEVVESPSGKSDVLSLDEAAIVAEPASGKSDVLEIAEAEAVAEPASSKSDVISLDEAAVVEGPVSSKSDVLEIAEAEAVAEPASGKSDVLDLDAAQILLESPSGKSDVVPVSEAEVVAEPASGKSDVLEISEAEAVAEPASSKSDVLDLDAARTLLESPSGKSDVVAVDEAAVVEGPVSSKSDVLEIAEADTVEPASSKSDVLDLSEAAVVTEPASVKSDVLEIGEAEAVAEPASAKSDVLDIEATDVVAETPSGKAAPPLEIVDEAEPQKAPAPPLPPVKQDPKATRIAGKAPTPTMLATEDLGGEGPGSELGGLPGAAAAAAAAPPPAPPQQEPPKKQDPKATRIAGKAPAPTMLAGDDLLDEGPGSELRAPGAPPVLPNLQLDSGKQAAADEVIEVPSEEVVEEAVEDVSEEDLVDAADALEPDDDLAETIAFGPPGEDSGKDASALDVLVEGASEVDLGHKAGPKGASGVDMIAEALESGVNLAGDSGKEPAPPAQLPRGGRKSEVDLEGVFDETPDSSSVDLGADAPAIGKKRPTASDSGEEIADVEEVIDEDALAVPESSGEGSAEEALLAEGYALKKQQAEEAAAEVFGEDAVEEVVDEEATLDVGEEGADLPQVKKKGTKASDDDVVLGEEGAVVEEAVEEAVDSGLLVPKAKGKTTAKTKGKLRGDDEDLFPEEEEDRKRGRKEKSERVRGGGGRVLIGMLLGILLFAAAGVGIWYLAPNVFANIPESPNLKGYKWQKGQDKKEKQKLAAGNVLLAARRAMDDGDFDGAIDKLKEEVSPEGKVMRGDARWQKYVEEQRKKDAALEQKDDEVGKALDDFKTAENKYFPGHIKKTIDRDAEARAAIETDKAVRDALTKADLLKKGDKVANVISDVIRKKLDYDDLIDKMTRALVENNQWKKGDPLKAGPFKGLVEDLSAAQANLDAAGKTLKVAPREVPKTVTELVAERKSLDERITAVNAKLKDAGVKGTDDKGVKELADARDTLLGQKNALDAAIGQALGELKLAGSLPAGDDPKKQLVEGIRLLRLKSESPLASSLGSMFASLSNIGSGASKLLERGFDTTSLQAQLAAAKAREALNETPDQRLDTLIALMHDRRRKDPVAVKTASKFLEWVNSKEAKAAPETKAKALYALGLALRNFEQFPESVQSLKQGVDAAAAIKAPPAWLGEAQDSYKELTDAAAYFLPRVKRLEQQGKLAQALEEVDLGLKALPGEPRLLAQRGLVRLDMVQPPAKLDADTQKLVEKDAADVQKSPRYAAEGHYLMGRLEEQTGNVSKAEQSYTKAIELNQGSKEDLERYKTALGNLLLLPRPAQPPAPAPKGKAAETSRLEDAGPAAVVAEEPQPPVLSRALAQQLVVLLVTGVQPPDEDEDLELKARLQKATKLAEDLIKSDNPKTRGEGYMILGQIYTQQGKRTEGLLTYVKGLELYYPGKKTEELARMVNDHPCFQQPEPLAKANPRQAERHFGKGLDYFGACNFTAAEEQFRQAVVNFDQDARYQYFLGLARYAQQTKAKRQAAVQAWREGSRLEAANRPNTIYVNSSLERLQGELRQVLDNYRQKTP